MLLRTRVRELGGIVEQGVTVRSPPGRERRQRNSSGLSRVWIPEPGPATWWVATARTAGYVTYSGLAFDGQPYAQDWLFGRRRPGWSWVARTRYTCSSAQTACLLPCIPMGEQRWRSRMPTLAIGADSRLP